MLGGDAFSKSKIILGGIAFSNSEIRLDGVGLVLVKPI